MTIGIYTITEIETGKVYVGQSVNVERRWKQHKKHRPDTQFHYRIVHVLSDADAESLDALERFYIQVLDCLSPKGLNRAKGGWGRFGFCDDEMRKKMSDKAKGRVPWNKGPQKEKKAYNKEEHRKNLALAQKGKSRPHLIGRPVSDETRQKIREKALKRWKERRSS